MEYLVKHGSDPLGERKALYLEGCACFWRIQPADLDTVRSYVQLRDSVLDLEGTGPDPKWTGLEEVLADTSSTYRRSKHAARLRHLQRSTDHALAYFNGLELHYHAYVTNDSVPHHTCVLSQLLLVSLFP